jgi:hypothetical protein
MNSEPHSPEAEGETSDAKLQTLRQLIDEGIKSPKVEAAEAFARLREYADKLAR